MLILTKKEVEKIIPLKKIGMVIGAVEKAFLITERKKFKCRQKFI